ncbi:MAG: VOC family protein [Bacteriovoracaceae bacterium]|jgi:catechol 2,3-dioxygenase-like lactoylglutathione lyase family enzyme|nr:VOC family protein [Bacteriovoracaceae bacterium]
MSIIQELSFGEFSLSLGVTDLQRSLVFYEALGFEVIRENKDQGWLILKRKELKLGLFSFFKTGPSGMTFHTDNVDFIYQNLKNSGLNFKDTPEEDNKEHLTILDPDGNWVLFDKQQK